MFFPYVTQLPVTAPVQTHAQIQTHGFARTAQKGLDVEFNPKATPQTHLHPHLQIGRRLQWERARTCCQQTSRGYLTTFSWSVKQLSGRRGPGKGPEEDAAVREGEADRGHEQGLRSLFGELRWQQVAPQEAAAAPALLHTHLLTLGRKNDTMTQTRFANTFPGNKRIERGSGQKRRRH